MKYLKLTALAILLLQSSLFAQQLKLKEKQTDDKGKITFAVPESSLTSTTENETLLLQGIASEKRLNFHLIKTLKDDKYQHNYYNFSFMNLEIVGTDYVVHAANGKILFANGAFPLIKDSSYQIAPKINSEQAESFLLSYLSEKKKTKTGNFIKKFSNKGLVWFYRPHELLLAYKIDINSTNPLQSGIYIIDATIGKQLDFYPDACTGHKEKKPLPNAAGTAETLYSGVQNFVADDNFNGGFRLRQVRNGVSISTLNANNQQDPETIINTGTDFFDNDNNWQAVEHGADRYATDVHWATQNVIDYWRIVHVRNSINGNGMAARGYVHTAIPEANNVNAFWDRRWNAMFYGDGDWFTGPIAAFDVVAHEFGHGICQYTSNLNNGFDESGALNEGFSDIWGAAIEAWAAPNKQRWLIGEDIFPDCLRNMQNPNDPFASEGQHPDTHHGDFWRLDGEPHFNSTVLSHWFYLLSVGGDGWNNGHTSHAIPGDGFHWNIQGIGINDAEMIAYLTERLLNSTADYAMARTMSIQAAIQMFGSCSNEVVQVTNAWFAVGVGAAWSSPSFQLYPTYGQDCSSVTVTANFPSSSNVIWTTTNGLLINGNNSPLTIQSNTVVISSPNGMEGYISASMGGCSASMVFCPCQPWDNPSITWVWSSPKRGEPLQAYVSPECPNAFRYLWYINGQLIETTYETFLSTYNWPCVDGELTVIALAACGSTAPVYGGNYSPICSQYGMTSNVKMYPNPASSKVTVKLEDIEISQRQIGDSLTSIKLSSISQIRIIDKMGVVKKIITSAKGSKASSFDVSDLPSDIYYLDITDRVNQVRLPLMIIR